MKSIIEFILTSLTLRFVLFLLFIRVQLGMETLECAYGMLICSLSTDNENGRMDSFWMHFLRAKLCIHISFYSFHLNIGFWQIKFTKTTNQTWSVDSVNLICFLGEFELVNWPPYAHHSTELTMIFFSSINPARAPRRLGITFTPPHRLPTTIMHCNRRPAIPFGVVSCSRDSRQTNGQHLQTP